MVILSRRGERERGLVQKFSRLLDQSMADYVLRCDQDGVWEETKVERLVGSIREKERELGKDTPILVFTAIWW
jgi:hypothetical protein